LPTKSRPRNFADTEQQCFVLFEQTSNANLFPRFFDMKFGTVVIGRNEGERLRRCFESLSTVALIAYVDSGSTDGSAQLALGHGVDVIELDTSIPFTAARARNVGLRRLQVIAPDLAYVQFVDGDCELVEGWLGSAISFLDAHAEVAVVFGRLRERNAELTVYNWLCDREWDGPIGEVRACGGIAMMRVAAFQTVGGVSRRSNCR
jgi:glycosyltransferase involved in cell wall biosynthesis